MHASFACPYIANTGFYIWVCILELQFRMYLDILDRNPGVGLSTLEGLALGSVLYLKLEEFWKLMLLEDYKPS